MTNEKKLELLEDVLNVDAGSLAPDMVLTDIDEWDSLAKLSLIVMLDDECNKTITYDQIKTFVSVKDIMDIME